MPLPAGEINPYEKVLGTRDPLAVMRETPQKLAQIVSGLGQAGLERSVRPGSWSARQIIAHLADTEIVFSFRIRQCLAEDHHVIQPFDQDRWNALVSERDNAGSLLMFMVLRENNVVLVGNATATDRAKPVTHPERGRMTFNDVIATIGGHDINHLEQLEKIKNGG